ncbi:MAG: NADH-quinone oxidoreductase subunit A [Deltaproteobacteria bacterium]|nr:NADH-quinone oxidoreductase subunit A [Deltaproteobacteria bacterium]
MVTEFAGVLVFIIVGILFLAISLLLARLFRPHHPTPAKLSTYECGEQPVGQAWIRFNNRFYLIALVFIIFDVEIMFLYPWGAAFRELVAKNLGLYAFIDMVVFIGILLVGLAYVWRKGDLAWIKPQQRF